MNMSEQLFKNRTNELWAPLSNSCLFSSSGNKMIYTKSIEKKIQPKLVFHNIAQFVSTIISIGKGNNLRTYLGGLNGARTTWCAENFNPSVDRCIQWFVQTNFHSVIVGCFGGEFC